MDINEDAEIIELRSPPRRRRSTFFVRRDSVAPQPIENENETVTETQEDCENSKELQRYYEALINEKDQWKREVNERKHKYHDLRQQYHVVVNTPKRSLITYSSLTNEDIEFLKGKQNIKKLIENQQNFHKEVEFTMLQYKRSIELDDVLINYAKEKLDRVTEYVLENSTVEPLDDDEVTEKEVAL